MAKRSKLNSDPSSSQQFLVSKGPRRPPLRIAGWRPFQQACASAGDGPDKGEPSPGSSAALPWGVSRDFRVRHIFTARIFWPRSMWTTVESLGIASRTSPQNGNWTTSVGQFKKAREARAALETFIKTFKCRELKTVLFARRALAEKKKGYNVSGSEEESVGRASTMPTKRKARSDDRHVTKRRKLDPSQGYLVSKGPSSLRTGRRFQQACTDTGSDDKGKSSTGSSAALPWGVFRNGNSFEAVICWPRSMWAAVERLGIASRNNPRASNWNTYVGHFKKAREARAALETFIENLKCRELKSVLFARRALGEKRKGYDASCGEEESVGRARTMPKKRKACGDDHDRHVTKRRKLGASESCLVSQGPSLRRLPVRIAGLRPFQQACAQASSGGGPGKGKPSPGNRTAALPWGVRCHSGRNGRDRFSATICWPRSMWATVERLGIASRTNPSGSDWKTYVGRQFKSAREARAALETFIHGIPCPKLKKILFSRRAVGEEQKEYVRRGDDKAGMVEGKDAQSQSRLSSQTLWALARLGPFSQSRMDELWAKWMVDEAVGRKRRSDPRTMLLMQSQKVGLDHFKRLDAKLRELHGSEMSDNTKTTIYCTLESCTRYFTNPGQHRLPPIPGEGQSDKEGESDHSNLEEVIDLTSEHIVCDVEGREWPLPPAQVKEEEMEKTESANDRESSPPSNEPLKQTSNRLMDIGSSLNTPLKPTGTSDKGKQRKVLS